MNVDPFVFIYKLIRESQTAWKDILENDLI